MDEALALAQANHLLIRNLLKYLVIEGPMEADTLKGWLDATIDAAEKSGQPDAAKHIRLLRLELLVPQKDPSA